MDLRRGDTVQLRKIVTGIPEKGSSGSRPPGFQGKVLRVFPEEGRVLVEGVRFVWKHQRPTKEAPKGARIQKEAPIPAWYVQLVCPNCSKPTRVARRREGKRNVRVCRECDKTIEAAKG